MINMIIEIIGPKLTKPFFMLLKYFSMNLHTLSPKAMKTSCRIEERPIINFIFLELTKRALKKVFTNFKFIKKGKITKANVIDAKIAEIILQKFTLNQFRNLFLNIILYYPLNMLY